jgi:hypothetical protein
MLWKFVKDAMVQKKLNAPTVKEQVLMVIEIAQALYHNVRIVMEQEELTVLIVKAKTDRKRRNNRLFYCLR